MLRFTSKSKSIHFEKGCNPKSSNKHLSKAVSLLPSVCMTGTTIYFRVMPLHFPANWHGECDEIETSGVILYNVIPRQIDWIL